MARQPHIRVSYAPDRGHLIRFRKAIELDPHMSVERKKRAAVIITELESILLDTDREREAGE